MALPPTIPTSFVPHPSGSAAQRFRADFTGAFGFFMYAILGIVFVLALGVFFYGRILSSSHSEKEAELAQAQAAIDPATIEGFVKLRDRLNLSASLLSKHVAFSNFFAALETLLPTTVRFSSLNVSVEPSGATKVEGSGVAKSFNALAAVSTAFAADGRIKDAIFSKIVVNKDSSITFGFSATLDPKLIAFSPSAATVPSAPAAPVTPSPL